MKKFYVFYLRSLLKPRNGLPYVNQFTSTTYIPYIHTSITYIPYILQKIQKKHFSQESSIFKKQKNLSNLIFSLTKIQKKKKKKKKQKQLGDMNHHNKRKIERTQGLLTWTNHLWKAKQKT